MWWVCYRHSRKEPQNHSCSVKLPPSEATACLKHICRISAAFLFVWCNKSSSRGEENFSQREAELGESTREAQCHQWPRYLWGRWTRLGAQWHCAQLQNFSGVSSVTKKAAFPQAGTYFDVVQKHIFTILGRLEGYLESEYQALHQWEVKLD